MDKYDEYRILLLDAEKVTADAADIVWGLRREPAIIPPKRDFNGVMSRIDTLITKAEVLMAYSCTSKDEARALLLHVYDNLLVNRAYFKAEIRNCEETYMYLKEEHLKAPCKRNYELYVVRTLKEEFGDKITTKNNHYHVERTNAYQNNRSSVNGKIESLLNLDEEHLILVSEDDMILKKIDSYTSELDRRVSDCRHVRVFTINSDNDYNRAELAFDILYESLVYRARLKAKGKAIRRARKAFLSAEVQHMIVDGQQDAEASQLASPIWERPIESDKNVSAWKKIRHTYVRLVYMSIYPLSVMLLVIGILGLINGYLYNGLLTLILGGFIFPPVTMSILKSKYWPETLAVYLGLCLLELIDVPRIQVQYRLVDVARFWVLYRWRIIR